jgi:hypothetical protein
VHSLGYADFFEDPMLWAVLGLLGLAGRVLAEQAVARARPPAEALEPLPDLTPRPAGEAVRT